MIPALIDIAVEQDCDYVLVVGDIFDKPKPDQIIKDDLIEQLAKYIREHSKPQFIFVVGNHDYTTKAQEYHSLNFLKIIQGMIEDPSRLIVAEPGDHIELDKLEIYIMENWEPVRVTHTKPLVLAWHGTVPGMKFSDLDNIPASVQEDIGRILKTAKAKYIALGDIHKCMKVGRRCYYSGPPIQKAYPDRDGYILLDIGKKLSIKRRRLKLPRKLTYNMDFKEGKDSEESIIEFVRDNVPKNNLVKLKFELPLSVWSSLNQARITGDLRKHCMELKLDNDPIPEQRTRKALKKVAKASSLSEEVEVVIDEEDFGLKKKKLKQVCGRYI